MPHGQLPISTPECNRLLIPPSILIKGSIHSLMNGSYAHILFPERISHVYPCRQINVLIVCPHRNNQPWQGQIKTNEVSELLPCDPKCFLCPNNTRAGGQVTNYYALAYFFENDFAAVNDLEVPQESGMPSFLIWADMILQCSESDLLRPALHQTEPACGKCFVICYNPRHMGGDWRRIIDNIIIKDLTMAELSPDQISPIINAWIELYTTIKRKHPNDLSAQWFLTPSKLNHIVVDSQSLSCDLEESDLLCFCTRFKNKGTMLGCSNPHPHEQIEVPDSAQLQDGRPSLLLFYAHSELNPKPSPRVLLGSCACLGYLALQSTRLTPLSLYI
ncbi:hypothetical protein MJO29_001319 [Puccinia striiformis f. sp. tritici]|nr:hypothetical protein MJO29_001319 [Puccinia striiformis f. sp. tritici]